MRRNIAFDIDGCVIDLGPPLQYYMKSLYNVDWDPYAKRSYKIEESSGLSKEEVLNCINKSIKSMTRQVIVRGSKRFIKKCESPILFVSNRWDEESTKKFFNKNFSDIRYKIIFTPNSKVKVLLKNKVTHFVEDRLDLANEVGKVGITVYLFESCHNQGKTGKNVIRVKSWKEIEELFFCTER
jgi:uncharacterized HAD superfamily protein